MNLGEHTIKSITNHLHVDDFLFYISSQDLFFEMEFSTEIQFTRPKLKTQTPFPKLFLHILTPSDSGNPASAQLRDFTVILNFSLACTHTHIQSVRER